MKERWVWTCLLQKGCWDAVREFSSTLDAADMRNKICTAQQQQHDRRVAHPSHFTRERVSLVPSSRKRSEKSCEVHRNLVASLMMRGATP